VITVAKVMGFATVQDGGRRGHIAEAVPVGGALSRRMLARANAALGNDATAAAIEVFGRLVLRAEVDIDVATESGPQGLRAGQDFVVDPAPDLRVRYVAVPGGVDAPLVLGSRSVLAGCFGHALRPGDQVRALGSRGTSYTDSPLRGVERTFRVVQGPDEPSSFAALLAGPWRVEPASDRRGTRLGGRVVPIARTDDMPSSPSTVGAIQLPASGEPIVVGPDGPTTGGYAIIGVVVRGDLDAFHEVPLGASIRFVGANLV
jgi:allophanate hydrolase subunit 2